RRRGDDVTITDDVVKAAAGKSKNGEVVMLLLNHLRDNSRITEEMVKIIAGSFYHRAMTLFLDLRGDDVKIIDEVVEVVAGNRRSGQVEVVEAAAGNPENGREVMELLLHRRGDDVTITKEVVEAAAGNRKTGRGVIELLLDRRRDDVTVTGEALKAEAGNSGRSAQGSSREP
ncbi:hypothetical protein O988_02179, partial [Pseudogymnoascus sp. VKM F-3808]